jgi:hypothetical protein
MTSVSSNPPPVRRLGDFEIVRELGRGGMGVVYEARQVSLNRKVALKVLSGGLGLTPQAVQRFRREAEAAARLHHTNIVPVYATGEQDGTHFYAMELIEGPSLDQVIREARRAPSAARPTPASEPADAAAETTPHVNKAGESSGGSSAWSSSSIGSSGHYFDTVSRLMAEVADALDYAHRQGVIHRDIKPSNLMVSPDGRLSLNDFGLARMLEQPGMTMTGEFVGTPAYMSPEQIVAGRVPLDHRTDIYSLGATLYELLTLERPFQGEQRDQILSQIIHKEPRPPRRINKNIPRDLETISLKALEKDPDRRYQSAGAMAEDLRRYVNRFAISARRVGPLGRAIKKVRRHPGLASGVAVAVAALIMAGFFAYDAHQAERRHQFEQDQAQQQLATEKRDRALESAVAAAMSGDLDLAEKAINVAESLGASPSQVRMLYGEVAYFRGDFKRAELHLEQAVKLDGNNVAARAMLTLPELNEYDFTKLEQAIASLDALSPRSTEDYLFKAFAASQNESAKGLQALDEAVRHSRLPIARALRGGLRARLAGNDGNPSKALEALADLDAAQDYLPENAYLLSLSVYANLVAANLYLEANETDKPQEFFARAERDAQVLKSYEELPWPGMVRYFFFDQIGDDQLAFDVVRRAAEKSDYTQLRRYYALEQYRRGQFADALQTLGPGMSTLTEDCIRAFLMAELHPANPLLAKEHADKIAEHYSVPNGSLDVLRFLGFNKEAIAIGRATKEQLPALSPEKLDKWFLDFDAADISEGAFLKNLEASRYARFSAHYVIALSRLATGDRPGARDHFRNALQNRIIGNDNWYLTRIFLERMEKDPTWPPWIPVKK